MLEAPGLTQDTNCAAPKLHTAANDMEGGEKWVSTKDIWLLLALLVIAGAYIFWDIGRPFNQTDEFLYGGVTQEMVESGDYVTPRFGPIELLTKPPLFYWLSSAVVATVGYSPVAMRLLPGCSFLLAMFLIFQIVRQHWSPLAGLMGAFIFFLCYDHLFNHVYKAGVMEGVLNLLMIVVLWLNMQLRVTPSRIRWIAVSLALALLTKSVFAVVPFAVTTANLWLNRGVYRITPNLLFQCAALFSAITLPWFVLVISAHGITVMDYMIVDQIWKRAVNDVAAAAETGRTFGRKENWYVLRHFLEYGQPWSLLVWPALWSATRRRADDDREKLLLLRLCCGWFIGVLLLFLMVRGRWSWYISSVYIPASILIAAMFHAFWRDARDRAAPGVWAGIGAIFFVSYSPFLLNPYAVSSGAFPLYGDPIRQVIAFAVMLGVVSVIHHVENESISQRAARFRSTWVLILGMTVAISLVTAAYGASARDLVDLLTAPAGTAMCLSILVLVPIRRSPIARAACLACPFVLGIAYLAAPLHWADDDNRRLEIKGVEREIARGHFQRERHLDLAPRSLFAFIPIYATFNHNFEVTYDAETRTIRLTAPPSAAGQPVRSVE